MARSLGIPAVVGMGEELMEKAANELEVVVDGTSGEVYFSPDEETLKEYQKKLEDYEKEQQRLKVYKDRKAETKDGKEIEVVGNI